MWGGAAAALDVGAVWLIPSHTCLQSTLLCTQCFARACTPPACAFSVGRPLDHSCCTLQVWQLQAVRLCQLCCLVLAAEPGAADQVVDAAATRLLQLLTCSSYWGKADRSSNACPPAAIGTADPGNSSSQCSAADAAAAVLSGLCAQPLPLLQAVRRLVCSTRLAQQQAEGGGDSPAPSGALQAGAVVATGRMLGWTL